MQTQTKPRILLVDDDAFSLQSTQKILELEGWVVETALDGQFALERIQNSELSPIDLVITDVRMPRMTGLEFLKALYAAHKSIPVILMTAFGSIDEAVLAMKFGAIDFLTKPFKRQVLLSAVKRVLSGLQTNMAPAHFFIGRSPASQNLLEMIKRVAPTTATVLISGESGTGKEKVARAIHESSPRREKPFVAINCAALPDHLLESELFGYEKGAFTGATQSKMGLFESASGGTLLLDEIGDMPLLLQVKILRVLQEGEVRRLGSSVTKKTDVRLIAASHRDLKKRVAEGLFREDLLFRLSVVGIHCAPLRERTEDLADLVSFCVNEVNQRHQKSVTSVSADVMQLFMTYSWPGNIRELQNVIERAVIFAGSPTLQIQDLPQHLLSMPKTYASQITIPVGVPLKDVEELVIRKTLEMTQGDKSVTAKLLGIHERTIYRKIKEDPQS